MMRGKGCERPPSPRKLLAEPSSRTAAPSWLKAKGVKKIGRELQEPSAQEAVVLNSIEKIPAA